MPGTLQQINTFSHLHVMAGVTRYWDKQFDCRAAKLRPGNVYITQTDEIITTVLGSCISVCLRDPQRGVAGMNHFMLPLSEDGRWGGVTDPLSAASRFGNFAMEYLINGLLKQGAKKSQLEVKVFGGGQMMDALTGVGRSNVDFVYGYLRREGMTIKREDVGGENPRKIIFFPRSGRVLLKRLLRLNNNTLIEREDAYQKEILNMPVQGGIELFK